MTPSVFIAIPCGKSAPDVDHSVSLTDTIVHLRETGVQYARGIIHGNCYVHLTRNLLTWQFLRKEPKCSHLFFWDDDVAAPPNALSRLLAYDRDIMVAAYPKKVAPGLPPHKTWPYSLTDGIPDPIGLLECDMVATGFLLIKRRVIETMCEMYADRVFHHEAYDADVIDLFPTGLLPLPTFPLNGKGKPMWWGEDYAFSVMARKVGFKIWMDPVIPLVHAGRQIWRGDFTKNADAPSQVAHSSAA